MKLYLKQAANILCSILLLPCLITFYALSRLCDKDDLVAAFSQVFSLIPGKSGSYLRRNLLHYLLQDCSRECFIGFGTLFSHANTSISDKVYIGPQCNIGMSEIREGALLGSGVHILSGKKQHNFTDIDSPIQEQGGAYEKISIGADTWIGNNAVIMANVGRKCIVGAGAVVTRDLPDFSIAAGNPAEIIKTRK